MWMGIKEGTSQPDFPIVFVCSASEVPDSMKARSKLPISGRTTPCAAPFSFRYSSRRTACVPLPEPEIPKNATVIGCMAVLYASFALSPQLILLENEPDYAIEVVVFRVDDEVEIFAVGRIHAIERHVPFLFACKPPLNRC